MTELEKLEKELLEEIQEEPEIYADTEEFCTINPETRIITVPTSKRILGTESDQETNRLYFKCPKVVGDNIDLSLFSLRINYQNAGNKKDQYLVEDVKEEGDNITFSWLLKRNVTAYKGNVKFILCAVKTTEDGIIKNEWNTTLNTECESLEGMEVDKVAVEEETKDIVEQLIAMMNHSAENAVRAVEEAKAEVDKEVGDFALKAQQALADVNNAGQAQTERVQTAGNDAVESIKAAQGTATRAVETAKTEAIKAVQTEGTTQAGNVSAEGEKQVQAVQGAAQEIMADREQIQMNKEGVAKLKEDIGNKAPAIIKKASGKTIIINDSSNLPIKALSGTGKIIITGKNILKAEKRNEFIPFEAKAGTLFTLITNGELSEGGNIKFIDENGEGVWFPIDKGATKKSSTIKKNVKGYVNWLSPKEGLKYCFSVGENDKYEEYVEQVITAPVDSEQLKAIHTNYPTTVLTSENEISVEYVADTEAYIGKRIKEENQSLQKQILEIQNALISQKISGGGIIQVKDSAKLPIQNLRVFGKSEQNGVPSLDAPVPIVNVGEKGNVNIAIDGQPQQKLYISTPNDLPGIKVDSSGNYTDENGQQWICDLINFKSGKYLQRIYKNILDGTETWKTWGVGNGTPDNTGFYLNSNEDQHMLNRAAMSNVLPYNMGAWNGSDVGCNAGPYIMMSVKNSDLLDTTTNEKALQSFKNYLAQQKEKGTPVIFYRALKIPVERDLTPEEIKAFKALHTNYPTTVITNDENAGMELTYTVDTKSYVDSKIATLSKAIL